MTNRQIALLTLIVGIIAAAAAVAVIPQFQCWVLHESCRSPETPAIAGPVPAAAKALSEIGKVAGVGGLSIGLVLFIFRDIIRTKIWPRLPPPEAYRLFRLIILCTAVVAIIGLILWAGPIIIGNNNRIFSS